MVQTRSASSSVTPRVTPPAAVAPTPSRPPRSSTKSSTASSSSTPGILSHTPSGLALLWLAVSLPLVAWDTGYIMLRPHSMPGGKWHKPIWGPYGLYGTVDYIYGFKAWEANNGFTAAQGTMNVVETALYLLYVWVCRAYARPSSEGAKPTRVQGRPAAVALLVLFSALIMTISKTLLYWLNEYWSGFDNIGHNPWGDLVLLWIIPNGAWLIFPTFLAYTTGFEIIDGMASPAIKTE